MMMRLIVIVKLITLCSIFQSTNLPIASGCEILRTSLLEYNTSTSSSFICPSTLSSAQTSFISMSSSSSPASPSFPTSTHTLVTPDVTLSYSLHGDASSPRKLVLIMGILTDGGAWQYQIEYFATHGYHVLSYDNRGVGKSSTPSNPLKYTTRIFAEDVRNIMDEVGWQRPHIVGVSMGGMIALELALLLPEDRIQSLTLVVTHAGGLGGIAPLGGVSAMMRSTFAANDQSRLKVVMSMLYSKASLADPKRRALLEHHHLTRMKERIPPKLAGIAGHSLAVYRHYVPYTSLLRLRYSSFPILVIVGDEDVLVRMTNSEMLSNVLAARLIRIENSGHGLLAECSQIVNKHLGDFFDASYSASKSPSSSPALSGDDDVASDAQEALLDSSLDGASPYSLEQQLVNFASSQSQHWLAYSISGFVTGFVPALLFRYLFYDSITMSSTNGEPVSRWEQSVKFGLIIGMARSSYRVLKCLIHAYRVRKWIRKHNLQEKKVVRNNSSFIVDRKGVPPVFNMPYSSLLLLALYGYICYKKQLFAGLTAMA